MSRRETPVPSAPARVYVTAGCADVARQSGVDPIGSASRIRSWLLIEHPGAWPESVLEDVLGTAFPGPRRAQLEHLWVEEWLRPLLIRRPGREGRRLAGRRTILVGSTIGVRPWQERVTVGDLRELADLDLVALAAGRSGHGDPVTEPVFCVCTQGSVDACCAVRGRTVVAELAAYADRIWEVSHLGGCRFAANLLVLPHGVMYGQLDPGAAAASVENLVGGHLRPEALRGRIGVDPWTCAAEVAVRRHLGVPTLHDVRAASVVEHPDQVLGEDGSQAAGADVVVQALTMRFAVRLRSTVGAVGSPSRCEPDGTDTSHIVVTDLRPHHLDPSAERNHQ